MNSTVTIYLPILYDDNPHELNSTLRSPGPAVTDTSLVSWSFSGLFLPFLSLHEPANYLTLTSVLPLLCRLALVFPSSLFFHPRSFNAHALIFLSVPPLTPFVLSPNRGSLTLLCFFY